MTDVRSPVSAKETPTLGEPSVGRWPLGVFIFALALALRLVWVFTLNNALTWSDEMEFATIAQHLARGDGYVSTSYRADPVLPVYLSAFVRLFGENYLAPRLGQS